VTKSNLFKAAAVVALAAIILQASFVPPQLNPLQPVHASAPPNSAAVAPFQVWGAFLGTSGDVEIDLDRTGIAVRVEIPREFLQGVVSGENDTHFVKSNIQNDYFYYSVVDESIHWSYGWRGNPTDGPCYKPRSSLRDPNAPWCVEIWDYLNGTFLTFTPPKFIRFFNLNAPSVSGTYNFTIFVATQTNAATYPSQCQNANPPPNFCSFPDFVHAWNTTLFVPVSMQDTPASISGTICDIWFSPMCPPIVGTKGIAYAQSSSGAIVARSYVNQTTGQFNLTGLAPGNYQILASAGFDRMTDSAYSLGSYCSAIPYCVFVVAGGRTSIGSLQLSRAPQVCGSIEYTGLNGLPLAHSLSDHPYLPSIGLKVLNITVEAIDSQLNVYRNLTLSMDGSSDSFQLIMGSNVTYVGTNPYGTEFAGLPSTVNGPYQLTLNVWISGYVQITPATVTVSTSPLPGSPTPCNTVSPNPVVMQIGGAISGTIQFWNLQALESPHQAETSLFGTSSVTDALFGGNVLIEAFDHTGILRAVSVINGTYANGTTIYRNNTSIPFFLIGFNEYLNHTWSGTWGEHDCGLPADSAYSIQVFIRGYELQTTTSVSLSLGASVNNLQLKMLRGGAFQVAVFSYDNRMGTRVVQAPFPWLFLHLGIPVRARTYFYDSAARTIGWVECVIRIGINQTDPLCRLGIKGAIESAENSLTVVFAGQNWSMREIWFFGDIPTHITNDNYTIKTFTLGYVWQYGPITVPNSLLGFAQVGEPLLIGDEIDITGPVFLNPQLLGPIPENDYAIGQVFTQTSGFMGAVPANLTAGTRTLEFTIFGYGGMTNSSLPLYRLTSGQSVPLDGQGHFFYVGTDGTRYFDYGLDNLTYTALVPEFGFNQHFMELAAPTVVYFTDLFLEIGIVRSQLAMAVVTSSAVTGWVSSANPSFDIAPLSWVMVTASNATFQRTVVTLDGSIGGPGGLDLPQGNYTITFSVPFYQSQTISSLYVQWGGGYPVSPPNGPLCPTAGTPYSACDPSLSNSQPNVGNGVASQNGQHKRRPASSALDSFLHASVSGGSSSAITEFTAATESPASYTNPSTLAQVKGLANCNLTSLFAQVESRGRYCRSLFSRLALCPRMIVNDLEYRIRPLLD